MSKMGIMQNALYSPKGLDQPKQGGSTTFALESPLIGRGPSQWKTTLFKSTH